MLSGPIGLRQPCFYSSKDISICSRKRASASRLEDLPDWPGFHNDLRDGWGRQIEYKLLNAEIVELTSFGKDGLPGGDGDNEDIIRQFQLHDEKGNWNDPLCGLVKCPLVEWPVKPVGVRNGPDIEIQSILAPPVADSGNAYRSLDWFGHRFSYDGCESVF